MIVFQSNPDSDRAIRIVLIFGVGLIGTSLCEAVTLAGDYTASRLPFDWDDPDCKVKHTEALYTLLKQKLEKKFLQPSSLSIVWSAGRAGFLTGTEETTKELMAFKQVLSIANGILGRFQSVDVFFHLVSSAGGLFEGAGTVHPDTEPKPTRPYGRLKLDQEQLLKRSDERLVKHIYRPTSVYGYFGESKRMGLISKLVLDGIRNRVSTIYGTMHTLRDYVLNRDIGAYIAGQLFQAYYRQKILIHYPATGKPSSIFEIQQLIERELGKKLLLQFRSDVELENTLDISVDPALLPDRWAPADVRTGIGYLTERIFTERKISVFN